MPGTHKKALAAILDCRTAHAGALLFDCDGCGVEQRLARSCGNRHCPTCQHHKAQQWTARQLQRQLPTHYFLMTFTVPAPVRAFLRSHQRLGYAALFDASADAIKTLAADPKRLGADLPGFFGVLHTWGRELHYHPHIHYLVPGGALSSADRQWHPASASFYLPVRALSRRFRAQFRNAMDRAGVLAEIPAAVWDTEWNVHCLPVGDGDELPGLLVVRVRGPPRRLQDPVQQLVGNRIGLVAPDAFAACEDFEDVGHGACL